VKATKIMLNALIVASIGVAASSFAQTDSSAAQQGTSTPPTSSQAKKEMQQNKQDPMMMQSSGGEDWSMLKGHEKGSISKADAPKNSWLASNFAKCDADQDGKVTEAEYTKCQRPQR
jgi:hypothetical protein